MAAFVSNQLQPLKIVTHNLPAFIQEPAQSLIGQECYTTLVYNLDLTSSECLKLASSKVLGLGMVAGGAILKLPQILTVVKSGSARGLSLSSYVLDTIATGITVAYNVRNGFPFSTYGEMGFLLAQNAVLIVLITSYSPRPTVPRLVPLLALLGSLAYALATPSLIPASTLSFLQTLTIPLSLSSKVPQIVESFKAKSTGQLSAFLVVNSLAGCLARVFTTMSETKDPLLLWNFALAALLNGVIFAQMIFYRGNTAASKRTGATGSPHIAVAEKVTAVKDKVVEVASSAAAAAQDVRAPLLQQQQQQQQFQSAEGQSTPKRNPAAAAAAAAAAGSGSGGPGSAGRRYVRKLD
ncbi:hypothetical protein JCM10908_006181 [Rhodotorula pacifica]|uniref:uncharacterized protein n=1 Tax=Rhodotorula pacifica TaxID=1495444 RepID=UPI00317F3BDC